MSTSVKERPILFSAPMVRAILNGSKSMTRRIMKPQPAYVCGHDNEEPWDSGDTLIACPYGAIGSRLWVRESIRLVERYTMPGDGPEDPPEELAASEYMADGALTVADAWPWKAKALPSIHCPRGLSRITLEITDVRVQRLHEISEEDAKAEGITPKDADTNGCDGYGHAFANLWESIHGAGSWDASPWVWAISFKRVEATHEPRV